MERRTSEYPMDFRWQQGHGPVAPNSSFLKPTPSQDEHKDGLASYKSSYSSYQPRSPKKLALPPPRNHSSFSSSPKEKPLIPHQNSSVMTPQRSNESGHSFDFKAHSSPYNSDSPDPPPGRDISQSDSTLLRSEETDVGEGSEAFATLERAESSGKFYSDSVPRRVYKRRRREADRHVCLLPDPDEDHHCKSDLEALPRPNEQKMDASHQAAPPKQAQTPGFISSVFNFVENHPNLPHILSYYAQFLLNLFIVFFMIYLVYSFWSTIRSDVDLRSREIMIETLAGITVCAREFRENHCERSMRVPAMEIMCNFWEKCINQDPSKVARAMVSANIFAEILNNFVEPITAKTMIVSFILIFGCFAISNGTLMFFRNKIPTYPPLPLGAYNTQQLAQLYFHPQQMYPDHYLTPRPKKIQEVLWRRQADNSGQSSIEMETPAIGYD